MNLLGGACLDLLNVLLAFKLYSVDLWCICVLTSNYCIFCWLSSIIEVALISFKLTLWLMQFPPKLYSHYSSFFSICGSWYSSDFTSYSLLTPYFLSVGDESEYYFLWSFWSSFVLVFCYLLVIVSFSSDEATLLSF